MYTHHLFDNSHYSFLPPYSWWQTCTVIHSRTKILKTDFLTPLKPRVRGPDLGLAKQTHPHWIWNMKRGEKIQLWTKEISVTRDFWLQANIMTPKCMLGPQKWPDQCELQHSSLAVMTATHTEPELGHAFGFWLFKQIFCMCFSTFLQWITLTSLALIFRDMSIKLINYLFYPETSSTQKKIERKKERRKGRKEGRKGRNEKERKEKTRKVY